MDPFTKQEANRLTQNINHSGRSEQGCPGWIYIRLPLEMHLDVDTLAPGDRLYAHIPVSNFIADGTRQPWHINGHASIWGKDELPPCPCPEMREHLRMLYQQIVEKMGAKESKGEHLAFRTRLYTVSWNEQGEKSWCFGMGHENGRETMEDIYNNDFLSMIYKVRKNWQRNAACFRPHIHGGRM